MVSTIASISNETRAPATVAGLEVFTSVPPWAIVHSAADNRNAPLIGAGEVAVIESSGQTGWYPVNGVLFLIEYIAPARGYERERRTRDIVETRRSSRDPDKWYAAGLAAPRTHSEGMRQLSRTRTLYCVDGPYDEQTLADRLIGRVVGIYDPRGATPLGRF